MRAWVGAIAALLVAAPAAEGRAVGDCTGLPTPSYDPGGAPAATSPNDPFYGDQTHLRAIKAPAAWARGLTGRGITIAILDSGVDPDHPEFAGRMLPGTDVLEDGDGDCPPGPVPEAEVHGTHVAGTAAAAKDIRSAASAWRPRRGSCPSACSRRR